MSEAEPSTPISLNADDLRDWVDTHDEKEYLVIDVRQPQEYRHGHIPGSMFLPLLELESKLFDLPNDRTLIFYCSNGGRSLAAATLVIDAEVTDRKVYNLDGGIMSWYGRTLTGFPRVKALDTSGDIVDLLYTAMDLEKGAWRFYDTMAGRFAGAPCAATLKSLSRAETAHAASVYPIWASRAENPPPFDRLFDDLAGDILEGGGLLSEAFAGVTPSETADACIDLIELSLLIEYRAFDLYRTTADRAPDGEARDVLLSLAQAEKAHMRVLTQALESCGG